MIKILVADDSLTIQKIVKITLEEHFELKIVSNQNDLIKSVQSDQYSMVLLDYALSPEMDGLELSSKLRTIRPEIKILLLFGTFDSIDQEKLRDHLIDGHLVKPFDGKDLIDYCLMLAKSSPDSALTSAFKEEKLDDSQKFKEEDDLWVVASTGGGAIEEKGAEKNKRERDQNIEVISDRQKRGKEGGEEQEAEEILKIEKEMQSWGVEIPPKIKDLNKNEVEVIADDQDPTFPNEKDLEYPQLDEIKLEDLNNGNIKKEEINSKEVNNKEIKVEKPIDFNDEAYKLSSELISESDLNLFEEKISVEGGVNFDDTGTFSFALNHEDLTSPDHPSELIKQIGDEISTEEFWMAETMKSAQAEPDGPKIADIDYEKIKPMVEKIVEAYCKEIVEKMVWKIVPEMAEKIIKNELEKLSDETKQEIG